MTGGTERDEEDRRKREGASGRGAKLRAAQAIEQLLKLYTIVFEWRFCHSVDSSRLIDFPQMHPHFSLRSLSQSLIGHEKDERWNCG